MKFNRLTRFGAAMVLSLSSLLAFAAPAVFAAGPFTCTWTGAGTDTNFSTAANWSGCNSAAPQAGDNDNLVFSVTSLTSDAFLTNDITNLNVGNITFQGASSSNFVYFLSGGAMTISGGVTANAAGDYDIGMALTISGNQTFSSSSANNNIFLDNSIDGLGNITKTGAGTLTVVDSPSYSGVLTANGGDVDLSNGGTFTFGGVVVNNGASVLLDNEAGADDEFDVPLTLGGNGDGGLLSAIGATGAVGFTQVLASPVVLTSDVQVDGTGGTVDITGALSGAHTITVTSGQAITLNINSSNNTSNTPNTPSGAGGSSSSAGAAAASTAAPKVPNTGLAAVMGNPLAVIGSSIIAAAALLVASRRLNLAKR